jgi:hypothetical protein
MAMASQQPGESDTLGFQEPEGIPERRQRGVVFKVQSGDLLWLSAVSAPDAPAGFRPVTTLRVVSTPRG